MNQFVTRGSPRRLPAEERRHRAIVLNADERALGARDPWSPGEPTDPVSSRETRRCRASGAAAAGRFGNRQLHVRMALRGYWARVIRNTP